MFKSGLAVHSYLLDIMYLYMNCLEPSIIRKKGEHMSKRDTYESKAEQMILPITKENHFELVDIEYVKEGSNWYLRTYIDKPGGITIDDCELVSRAFSELLDKDDFIEDAYIMEVSSPGLLRPIKKEKDYKRNMGKPVEIRTFKMINKQKEFVGTLLAYDSDFVTIQTEQEEMKFGRNEIALIRPFVEFD